jgi:pantothenate kinase
MSNPEDIFLQRLEVLTKLDTCPGKRIIIALAGAPGSGKSTVAAALTKRFNATHKEKLQVVPMV